MGNFWTYDSAVRVEDVRPLIANVSITETPYVSNIGTAPNAEDTEHKWMTDTIEDSADNAGIEGSDPTYPSLTDPSKVINITQILRKPFQITLTKLNVKHHGMADNWSYQKTKKTIALKKDLEKAALFGTIASGTGSAARRMKGLISFISSYKDGSSYSGQQLSPSIFDTLAQNIWTNSNVRGGVALVGAYQKRRISENFASFDSANRREVVIGDRTLSIPIDQIITDFGTYEIQLSHEMNSVVPSAVVTYLPDFNKLAYLMGSEPRAHEYAPTGLSRKGEVVTEVTLEVHNEKTSGMLLNLATS
jgi:hypothetical protein